MNLIKPDKLSNKTKLYFIIGFITVAILATVLLLLHQATNQVTHINIPLTDQYPTIPPSAPAYTAVIQSVGASGVTGKATFEDVSGTMAILLHIDGMEEDSIEPIEIHEGACSAPGSLAYVLVTPDALESETDLTIDLKQFNTQKPMAVILYRSNQDRTIIACGDIP